MEGKMKAAVLHGINDLRIDEVEIPRLDEHDVLVRVSACGVCGSDLPRILHRGPIISRRFPVMNLEER